MTKKSLSNLALIDIDAELRAHLCSLSLNREIRVPSVGRTLALTFALVLVPVAANSHCMNAGSLTSDAVTPLSASPSTVVLEGIPRLLLTPIRLGSNGLATSDFWTSPDGAAARAFLAAQTPGAVVSIVDQAYADLGSWRLGGTPRCGSTEDCIPPGEPIFHLVAPCARWGLKDISVRSSGELFADFPLNRSGQRERVYTIVQGPNHSIVEASFVRPGQFVGFKLEFDVADPADFSGIVVQCVERAVNYMRFHKQ